MNKMPNLVWIKFKDQEPPLYIDLLVTSDEGLMIAQYRGDNEWTEGGIAWVTYWMIAPTPPEWPLSESALCNTTLSPEELAIKYASINGVFNPLDAACRYLKNAFLAGHKIGHTTGFQSAMKIQEAVTEHMEKEYFAVVQHEPLLTKFTKGKDE